MTDFCHRFVKSPKTEPNYYSDKYVGPGTSVIDWQNLIWAKCKFKSTMFLRLNILVSLKELR
jgi:hypothetical protein